MEQQLLFSFSELDNQEFKKKAAKIKLNYSFLLKNKPQESDEELYKFAIIYRKIIGELLIDLSEYKLEAKNFLTNDSFDSDRSFICAAAYIHIDELNIWVQQILDGALCFNKRILDDHIKYLLGIKKSDTPPDLTLEEDWGLYYPIDALNKKLRKRNENNKLIKE